MPNFLGGLFESKSKAKANEAVSRATGSSPVSTFASGMGIGQVGGWDIDKAVRDGMERVTWVFRCVDVIAQKQSSLPIIMKTGFDKNAGEVMEDERLFRLLNFKTNSYERASQFRYRLSVILLLSRRGAFIEVINGRDGRPSEMHLLPPGVTRPIPDAKKFVAGYEVTRNDGQVDRLEADRVIWIKLKPHPTDPYAQMTPLMSAGLSVETDFLAHVFNRNFLATDGRPGMLITVQGKLNHEDALEIKRRFSGGPNSAGQTSVIEADGIDVADTSSTPRDVQWAELLNFTKEEILLAFGVPESVMGNASGRTFDNADAERENFYVDTVVPHCDAIAQGLDPLTGDIEDDTITVFDYSGVDVLQRIAIRKREEWRAEVAAGLRTIDEYFDATGQEKWDVVGTRILWHTSGIAIAKNPDDQAAIMTLKPVGQPDEGMSQEEQSRRGAEMGAAQGMRSLNNIIGARATMLARKDDNAPSPLRGRSDGRTRRGQTSVKRNRTEMKSAKPDPDPATSPIDVIERKHLEGMIEGILESWDQRQGDIVTERLDHVKSRKGTRHWETTDVPDVELKKIDPKYAVDERRWLAEIRSSMQTALRRNIMREATAAAKDMRDTGVLEKLEARRGGGVGGRILQRVFGGIREKNNELSRVMDGSMQIIETAARNQLARVEDTIARMDAEGYTLRQIQAEVRRMTGKRGEWRKRLSINVATSASEGARAAVYSQAGSIMRKTWVAEEDERVRATHRRADGQTVRSGTAFRVGKARLQYPGDPSGPPEEVINCRCYLSWEPDYNQLGI